MMARIQLILDVYYSMLRYPIRISINLDSIQVGPSGGGGGETLSNHVSSPYIHSTRI